MNDREIMGWLHRYGHFANRLHAESHNVTEKDLDHLKLTDETVRQAVASLQGFDANMESLCFQHHGRSAIPDGEIGPATRELMNLPRCGCPDFAPASDEATGGGSWPSGCLDGTAGVPDDIHAIRIDVNAGTMPAHVRKDWTRIKQLCIAAYAEVGLMVIYVEYGERSEVDLKWKSFGGSTIGLAQFNDQRCSDNVFQYLSKTYRANATLLGTLHIHETGHNVNLRHTRGGIMNPSILRTANDWSDDPSYSSLRKYFGGEPLPVPSPPDPTDPDPPVPQPSPVKGVLTIEGRLYNITGRLVE